MKMTLIGLAVLALPQLLFAGDLYVSISGKDSNPGNSADKAYRTIQMAASKAVAGTTVHVAPGVYNENIRSSKNGTASARIRFVSDKKWGAKIVPPASSSAEAAWDSRGAYVTIENFEVDCSQSTRCLNGLYVAGSNSVVKGNHVHHLGTSSVCTSKGGSGINADGYYKGSNIEVENNIVHHIGTKTCTFIQGIYHSTTGTIKNNLVYKIGAAALHLWHDANNIIIANNTAFASGFGLVVGGGDFKFRSEGAVNVHTSNNIIFDNKYGISEQGVTGADNTYKNNLVFKNTIYDIKLRNNLKAVNTIAADPQFVSYQPDGVGDFRLKASSPAVDRGIGANAPATDIEMTPRQPASIDIGAYELKKAAEPVNPLLSLSASVLNFGAIESGDNSDVKIVTLTNSGSAPLIFTKGFSFAGEFTFGGRGSCKVGVAYGPKESCTASVIFKPKRRGHHSGRLVIPNNVGSTLYVKLNGLAK